MPHSPSADPPVLIADGGTLVAAIPSASGKLGKHSTYLNQRAIVKTPLVAAVVDPASCAVVDHRSYLSTFQPWQIAVIGVLAVAAWAVPIGLVIMYFSGGRDPTPL